MTTALDVLARLVAALPRCERGAIRPCRAPATHGDGGGAFYFCDAHTDVRFPELPLAPTIREAIALLAGEAGTAGVTATLGDLMGLPRPTFANALADNSNEAPSDAAPERTFWVPRRALPPDSIPCEACEGTGQRRASDPPAPPPVPEYLRRLSPDEFARLVKAGETREAREEIHEALRLGWREAYGEDIGPLPDGATPSVTEPEEPFVDRLITVDPKVGRVCATCKRVPPTRSARCVVAEGPPGVSPGLYDIYVCATCEPECDLVVPGTWRPVDGANAKERR